MAVMMMMAMRVSCGDGNHGTLKVNETRGAVNQRIPAEEKYMALRSEGVAKRCGAKWPNLSTRFVARRA
jgi:hypothetical protein